MRKIGSATDFTTELNKQLQHRKDDHFFAEKAGTFATFMQGTNGRDKMCALIQYTNELYYQCMITSDEPAYMTHYSVDMSRRISENISSSRKMLKFLKFFGAFKKAWFYATDKKHKPLY